MRNVALAVCMGTLFFSFLCCPLYAEDFGPISPERGAPVGGPPTFTWGAGGYDRSDRVSYAPTGVYGDCGIHPLLQGVTLCKAGVLFFQPQGFNDGPVAVDVLVFDIIQQAATPADQHQKPSSGMVILLVNF